MGASDTMYSYCKCFDEVNLVNLEVCEKELCVYAFMSSSLENLICHFISCYFFHMTKVLASLLYML